MEPPPPPTGQPSGSRRAAAVDTDQWSPFKDYVRQLYLKENKKMTEVVEKLKESGFAVSFKQAENQINNVWKFRKQLNRNDQDYIEFATAKRELEGKDKTRVKLCGEIIPKETIMRKRARLHSSVLQGHMADLNRQKSLGNGSYEHWYI
ncbi:hypothetical protein ABW20_dc0103685 [Dactylellina cionopaga]|nr:hypothetical protein ABW20_dc0103685 [Dactylellina cionopaga]